MLPLSLLVVSACAGRASSAPRAAVDAPPVPSDVTPDTKPSSGRVPFETGIASFYHPSLAGNETANGERYVPSDKTCAHPKLAFNTMVEVKLVRTGASAVCRINDRGPFAMERVIDLSMGMAEALGVPGDDIHKVELYSVD